MSAGAKRLINCAIPISICNMKCHYCYITQHGERTNEKAKFMYSPEYIGKALSVERLGGVCLFNLCGAGETLLAKEVPEIIYHIVKQGHFVELVTNATITQQIDRILEFPKECLERIEFKCSFHYLELIRLNLMDVFLNNVKKVREAGCSINVEVMPTDELIPYIEELKKVCMDNFGALCHLTVGRADTNSDKGILTKYSKEEYKKIWGQFESQMFEHKLEMFEEKRTEFCYAGDWSIYVDLTTGKARKCYASEKTENIFENIDKPIKFEAIGCNCKEPHCFNSHALLTLGNIPELNTITYEEIRNRKCKDGTEWLNSQCKEFMKSKFIESNHEYGKLKKLIVNCKNRRN